MKQNVLIALSVMSLYSSSDVISPVEKVEVQALDRTARIATMKGAYWSDADKHLNDFNNTLITRARYLDTNYPNYFKNGAVSVPAMPEDTAGQAYLDLMKLDTQLRRDWDSVANLTYTQKLANKDFQLLCREVGDGLASLEALTQRILELLTKIYKIK